MKISSLISSDKKRLKSKKTGSSNTGSKSVSFESSLQSSIETERADSIENLMNDLKDQERRFLDAQNLYELNQYKQKIQKLLKIILDESFQTHNLKRRRRDRADYLIIKQINDKLADLATKITAKTNKAFNLMKSLEEIRGLVCDLVY